jgi:hypothetical protein
MQPYPEAIPSIHLHTTPSPKCAHVYLRQSTYPSLPPLYIAAKLRGPRTSSLPLQRIAYLQCSYEFLGSMKPRLPYIGRDVDALRKELEGGMSRDSRKLMRRFVRRLKDKRQRRAPELYLARYPGFVLDVEGKLDYGVGTRMVVEKDKPKFGGGCCTLM